MVMVLLETETRDALPRQEDAERDVDAMFEALGMQNIRRYMDQKHWAEESKHARAADEMEPGLKL